jgi:hypothetical protein
LGGQETRKESPIQDNSFLVEEAYNQETGVVQHISTWQQNRSTREWGAIFTQEWPVGSLAHQFSFTLPAQRLLVDPQADGFKSALGDVALNYRDQVLGDGDAGWAISPRVSVCLPTGDEKWGMGWGAASFEFQLPVSWAMADQVVSHTNSNLSGWGVGQCLIWRAHPRFNEMLDWLYRDDQVVAGPSQTLRERSTHLNPGIRWAHDFASGLQVVPDIAFPFGVGPSRGEKGIFLYLSIEHPFSGQL